MTARAIATALLAVVGMMSGAAEAAAQAWVLSAREGDVTLVVQEIDHVGRMTDDGTRSPVGKAVNWGIDVELDYAFTDRFSISTSLPYIASKYTDPNGPPPFLPFPSVDACRCWHSEFADFGLTARYNVLNVNRQFMLTPSVAFGAPSHNYEYVGEAVVGRRLQELRLGVDAGQRLDAIRTTVQARYLYTAVPRVLDIPNNRSNGAFEADFAVTRRLSVGGIASWQRTHGGLRFPDEVEGYPERLTEFHRMLRDNYLHAGAEVSYAPRLLAALSLGPSDSLGFELARYSRVLVDAGPSIRRITSGMRARR